MTEQEQTAAPDTPAQAAVPKSPPPPIKVLGRSFEIGEIIALDIAHLEEKAGKSMADLVPELKSGPRMTVALALIWVLIRKSGKTHEDILAGRWAITWEEMGLVPFDEIIPLAKAVAPFFTGTTAPASPDSSSTQPDASG